MQLAKNKTTSAKPSAKPILKWAGGKTQLLKALITKAPGSFNRYIEPFIGGGALFFALQPKMAVIADSNPELINVYNCLANNVEAVILPLKTFKHKKKIKKTSFIKLERLNSKT